MTLYHQPSREGATIHTGGNICASCGRPFAGPRSARYCGQACVDQAARTRRLAKKAPAPAAQATPSALPLCIVCGTPFTPARTSGRPQVICLAESCKREAQRRRMAAYNGHGAREVPPAIEPQPLPIPRADFTRGRTPIVRLPDGSRIKICKCGNRFPVEVNSRGQMTSRKLCDACRNAGTLPEIPADVPRCKACTAIVGLHLGGVTHLDEAGNCPACAAFLARRAERDAREREGWRFVGGLPFPPATATMGKCGQEKVKGLPVPVLSNSEPSPPISPPTRPETTPPYWRDGLPAILAEHGVTWAQVLGPRGIAEVVAARAEVAAYQRWQGLSLVAIGRMLGRCHQTIGYLLAVWDMAHGGTGGKYHASSAEVLRQTGAAEVLRQMAAV